MRRRTGKIFAGAAELRFVYPCILTHATTSNNVLRLEFRIVYKYRIVDNSKRGS